MFSSKLLKNLDELKNGPNWGLSFGDRWKSTFYFFNQLIIIITIEKN